MSTIQVKVSARSEAAVDVAMFELAAVDGKLPAFGAGAHIDVHTPSGAVRQYSLCNDPAESHRYQIAVLREPASRGGSVSMHDSVKTGDLLTISTPRNHFALVPGTRFILFAGGIGITPILCMAERLHALQADFELHYCTRAPERTAFLERIRSAPFAGRVRVYHDSEGARLDARSVLARPAEGTHAYSCGPAGFIEHVCSTARALGWHDEQIHVEYFAAAAKQSDADDTAFDIKLASSGRIVRIEADETVVAGLARHGVEIEVSCEQGVCGTCITRVLEGVPDHRDSYFTEQEKAANAEFTPCCSRSRSPLLVLDL